MTQRDLAAAVNYSDSLISSLEKELRLPDLDAVIQPLARRWVCKMIPKPQPG